MLGSDEVPDSPNRSLSAVPASAPPLVTPIADRFEVALQKEKKRTGSQSNTVTLPAEFVDETGKVIKR